jgi:CDP-diglyceride synthetase
LDSQLLLVLPSSFWIATLNEFGVQWILFPALLVIINDTLAYFCGVFFGQHAMLPIISPNKTWQGFVGAWLVTWAFATWWFTGYFAHDINNNNDSIPRWLLGFVWAALASWVTPFGGFLASIVKRAYGSKDFAQWIPGHGGLVDRLDCHLVMAPLTYMILQYQNSRP